MSAADGSGNGTGKAIAVPTAAPLVGQTVRREFDRVSTSQIGETATTAMAAHAEAMIKARCSMAIARPRDLMLVRARLLKDCARPGFADEAIYRKPIGDGIEGPSIRMAEAAMRAMTNMETSVEVIYDDPKKRLIRVTATDYESNNSHHKDVTVPKTMERSKVKPGQVVLKQRQNSQGKPTYLVEAETDDDILNAEAALASKALRVCILRHIPGDILAEAVREAYRTLEQGIKDDPDKALKGMCDAYELELGITMEQVKDYLGHPIDQTTVAEIASMKKLYTALKEGEATWAEIVDSKVRGPATDAPKTGAQPPAAKGKANLNDLAAAAAAKRTAPPGATPAGDPLARAAAPATPKPAEEDKGDVPSDADWSRGP